MAQIEDFEVTMRPGKLTDNKDLKRRGFWTMSAAEGQELLVNATERSIDVSLSRKTKRLPIFACSNTLSGVDIIVLMAVFGTLH